MISSISTTQFLGGGLILGLFFVATDCVTSPITRKGQIWYGVLIGVMTAALRLAGIEEGMVYAILVSNLCVPFMEQLTVPKPFGSKKTGTGYHKRTGDSHDCVYQR